MATCHSTNTTFVLLCRLFCLYRHQTNTQACIYTIYSWHYAKWNGVYNNKITVKWEYFVDWNLKVNCIRQRIPVKAIIISSESCKRGSIDKTCTIFSGVWCVISQLKTMVLNVIGWTNEKRNKTSDVKLFSLQTLQVFLLFPFGHAEKKYLKEHRIQSRMWNKAVRAKAKLAPEALFFGFVVYNFSYSLLLVWILSTKYV